MAIILDHKLLHLQLVNALSQNDLDEMLQAIFKINTVENSNETYGSPLHLIVSISSVSAIQMIISTFCTQDSTAATQHSILWINALNSDRETPLHIASKLGRLDVLELLFQIPTLNDTIRQISGKTAEEMASNDQVGQLFARHREEYINAITSSMTSAITVGDHAGLESLFESNIRAQSYLKQGWIDINASIDQQSERSLLHLAAKSDNLELAVWAIKYGADPNVKDAKHKRPIDLAKSDRVKEILRHAKAQAPIISASLQQATSSSYAPSNSAKEAPVVKGYLAKWTNYKDGYKSRYFVLEGGVFSYYHDIKDYPSACRGSISTLAVNAFFPDSKNDPSRFDVIGSGNMKYSLKARSPADAKRWVWALMESKVWLSDASKKGSLHNVLLRRGSSFHSELPIDQHPLIEMHTEVSSNNVVDFDDKGMDDEFEEKDDLLKYLDKYGSNDFKSPEIHRFIVLLTTEMQVQKETVQSALDLVTRASQTNESTALQSLLKVPPLLKDSSQHIEALIFGIVRHCNKREFYWTNQLKRVNETHKRLEDIFQKMSTTDSLSMQERVGPVQSTSRDIDSQNDGNYSDSEQDEFYDAQDITGSIIESSVFGLDASSEIISISPKIISKVNTGFLDLEELMDSCFGYTMIPRLTLPLDPSIPMPALAVWSFLKSAIGKDLSKITLPVLFNEPLSMLQRMCEDIEFIELLALASRIGSKGKAESASLPSQPAISASERLGLDYQKLENLDEQDSSPLRILFVAAFAISNYSSTINRTSKPFNPLLGETFELSSHSKNYRYVAEQVCHHPPISACHCESPDFKFWTEVYIKSKFWGKSLELNPLGTCHVVLPWNNRSEHYSWKKVTTCVNNLILGTLTIEHYGELVVKNHRTGEECVITFKPKDHGGWFGGGTKDLSAGGVLIGLMRDCNGLVKYELNGRWDELLTATPIIGNRFTDSSFDIWRVNERQGGSKGNFNFTDFGLILNQSTPELDVVLPLTDSRLRPDQKAMEQGLWHEADVQKEACESLQRARRKLVVAKFEETRIPNGPPKRGIDFGERWWSPRWFVREIEKDTNEEHWRFSDEYWSIRQKVCKREGDWPVYVDDIFGIKS